MINEKNETRAKIVVFGILMVMLFLIGTGIWQKKFDSYKHVITIGVFSDSYWNVQNGYSYKIVDDAIKIFEKRNPDYEVKYVSGIMKEDYSEWLAEALMKGEEPDLFFILGDDFNDLSNMDAMKDLSAFIKKEGDSLGEQFYQPAYKYGMNEDGQYALPFECAPKLMLVNESILKAEGLEKPGLNWTWDEFYDICNAVTKDLDGNGTLDQFGVASYSWEDAFSTNGIQVFDNDGKECRLQGEPVLEALRHLERLRGLNADQNVTERDFNLGKVAFMPMLFSEYRAYKSYPLSVKKYTGFEWGCTTMPAGEHGENLSVLDTLMIGMSNRTAHEEKAWELMKILTTNTTIQSEIYTYSEGIPAKKSVTEADTASIYYNKDDGGNSPMAKSVLTKVMNEAVVIPRFSGYDEATKRVGDAVDTILSGDENFEMEMIIQNRNLNRYLKEK